MTPDAMTGRHKLILLAVKEHHTEAAVRALAPYLAEDGAVVEVAIRAVNQDDELSAEGSAIIRLPTRA